MMDQFLGGEGMGRMVECLRTAVITGGDADIAAALARRATLHAYEPGQLILREGGSDDDIYMVLTGTVSIQFKGRHMAVRSSVTHIGELALMDPNSPRAASARAIDHVICAKLSEPDFSAVATEYPQIWKALAVEALNRLGEDKSADTADLPPL